MPRRFSAGYTIAFSAAVCIVCSLLVSTAAVSLRPRQEKNARLDVRKNVLLAAGKLEPGQKVSARHLDELFEGIEAAVVELETGTEVDVDPATFDQRAARDDPQRSIEAPPNDAGIARLPKRAKIYKVVVDGKVDQLILPVEGKGLWSTLYGFIALDADTTTVRGITFYEHGETPGLGGEIDNPRWKALWRGRDVFDDEWNVKLEVIKGSAGPAEKDPHRVDGLSGATITSRGVSHLIRFWLGEDGFGPYLRRFREARRG